MPTDSGPPTCRRIGRRRYCTPYRLNWLNIIFLAIVLLAALLLSACGQEKPDPAAGDLPAPADALDITGLPVLGSPDAPITVIEFGDFACPFCGVFSLQTKPLIEENYIDQGLVRFAWRHYPIITDRSWAAAQAAACAHEQGAFWAYHDQLYEILQAEGHEAFQEPRFLAVAEDLGLDGQQYGLCLAENHAEETVAADWQAGQALEFHATPTFLVNEYVVMGAQPYEAWEEIFAQLLQEEK